MGFVKSIPQPWKKAIALINPWLLDFDFVFKIEELVDITSPSWAAYEFFKNTEKAIVDVIEKWKKKDLWLTEHEVQRAFKTSKITNITKYQSFQYKFMHNAILLNDRLYHLNVVKNQLCSFCSKAKETYYHFFFHCEISKAVWLKCVQYIKNNIIFDSEVTYKDIVTNLVVEPQNSFINLICLVYKQKLYSAKCQKRKPHEDMIIKEIQFIQGIEKSKISTQKQRKYIIKDGI